jgi:hypothetical protein
LLDLQPAGEVSRPGRCHEVAVRVFGSIIVDRVTEEEMLPKTCGIDWSEGQHDVAIVDDQARIIARPCHRRRGWTRRAAGSSG